MKKTLIACFVLFAASFLYAEKIADFSHIFYPKHLLVTDDRVYITDYPVVHIHAAGDLSHLIEIGGEGQGPGEFQFMDGIALDPEGRMYVSDRATRNVKILDVDGREIETLPSPGPSGKLARLSGGDLVSLYTAGESPSLLQRYAPDGEAVARYGTYERHDDADRSRYFNRVSFACGPNDSVYVAYATRNRIETYSADGDLLLSFDRPLIPAPPPMPGEIPVPDRA